jgi:hypothetical protein
MNPVFLSNVFEEPNLIQSEKLKPTVVIHYLEKPTKANRKTKKVNPASAGLFFTPTL